MGFDDLFHDASLVERHADARNRQSARVFAWVQGRYWTPVGTMLFLPGVWEASSNDQTLRRHATI